MRTRSNLPKTMAMWAACVLLTFWVLCGVAAAAEEKPAAPDKAPHLAGVTILNRYKCDDGYRLYSSRMTEVAHLIDIDGRQVHQWAYPQGKSWHYAEMLPNGYLLAIVKDEEIIELDWYSNLVWKADTRAHHDFYRRPNGNTIVLSKETVTNKEIRPDQEDWTCSYFVELTPKNQVIWEWHLHEHVKEMAELVSSQADILKDFAGLHTNSVEILPENASGKKDRRFRAGNLLFSCKKVNTIGIMDRKTEKVVWAWYVADMSAQHMPTMLENGHILLYDNGQKLEQTRIIELDPITKAIVWEYQPEDKDTFYSRTRGSNQRLPNGNTFIAESDSGRLFEVTPDGEIVWEFLNPNRHPSRSQERQPLYRAVRYPRDLVDRLLAKHAGTRTRTRRTR